MSNRPLVRPEEAVLLVIDAQLRLLPHIHEHGRLVRNIATLVRCARILDVPVLCTEQANLGDTAGEIRDALGAVDPIRKIEFSCFGCGAFREALAATGRKTLFLCGIEAHICVAQTGLRALPDYRVHLVADAVSSRTAENRDIGVERLCQAGAVVTSVEMAAYEWLVRAGTDQFRSVLPLIK